MVFTSLEGTAVLLRYATSNYYQYYKSAYYRNIKNIISYFRIPVGWRIFVLTIRDVPTALSRYFVTIGLIPVGIVVNAATLELGIN